MKKIFLPILFTLVGQFLSFAANPINQTHTELSAEDWKKHNGYVPVIIETHNIDSRWLVELVRFEAPGSTQKILDGIAATLFSMLAPTTNGRVYYHVVVKKLENYKPGHQIKNSSIDFDFFKSGTPPQKRMLRNLNLETYAYFGESAPAISIITPTLQNIVVVPNLLFQPEGYRSHIYGLTH